MIADLARRRWELIEQRHTIDGEIADVEAEMIGLLDGGRLRLGDWFYRTRKDGSRRIRDGAEPALWRQIISALDGDAIVAVRACFNPNTIRVRGMELLAEAGYPVDDLYEWVPRHEGLIDEGLKLSVVPLDKAPKYARSLDEGVIG